MADDARLDCKRASRLLSLACDRDLDTAEMQALKRHLDACLMCRNFSAQLSFLRKAAKKYSSG
jgi:hypothetical protein